ncbi:hypothetical protein GOODEAATRI_002092, partial [Goodea atripinnis]
THPSGRSHVCVAPSEQEELHLQLLASTLSQDVRRGVVRIASGAHNIGPIEHQLHGLQHVGRHHSCTQCLFAYKDLLMRRIYQI